MTEPGVKARPEPGAERWTGPRPDPLLADCVQAGLLGLGGLLAVVIGTAELCGFGDVAWWTALLIVVTGAVSVWCGWHLLRDTGPKWGLFALALLLRYAYDALDRAVVHRPFRLPGLSLLVVAVVWGAARWFNLRHRARRAHRDASAKMRA